MPLQINYIALKTIKNKPVSSDSKNRLDSMYFKPDANNDSTNEDSIFHSKSFKNNDSFKQTVDQPNAIDPFNDQTTAGKANQYFDQMLQQHASAEVFGDPFTCQPAEFINEIDASQFQPADNFHEILNDEEKINRKDYADNELSVMMYYNKETGRLYKSPSQSGSSGGSSGNTSSSAEWWANATHTNQPSRLELSNTSMSNESMAVQSKPGTTVKEKVKVDNYFNKLSDLPDWIQSATGDTNLSTSSSGSDSNEQQKVKLPSANSAGQDANDRTLCEEGDENSEQQPHHKKAKPSEHVVDEENITFSNSVNQTPTSASSSQDNFSFTFNTSDTGSFLIPMTILKATVPKVYITNPTPPPVEKKANPDHSVVITSLKEISDKLDQVKSRLATNSTTQPPTPITMDETLSSISSSDISSDIYKARVLSSHHHNQKIPNPAERSSNSSVLSNVTNVSSKLKHSATTSGGGGGSSGSLTSTPSKLSKLLKSSSNDVTASASSANAAAAGSIKSGSSIMVADKLNKRDKSSMDTLSQSHQHSGMFGQESFISSIPEKSDSNSSGGGGGTADIAEESTVLGGMMDHHRHAHGGKHHQSSKNRVIIYFKL